MEFGKFMGSVAGALVVFAGLALGARAVADRVNHHDTGASVVLIEALGQGHGTGFYIGNNQFVTAAHVAQMDDHLRITQGTNVVFGTVTWVDPIRDVAIVTADKSLEGVKAANLACRTPDADVGTAVTSIGYPLSLGLTVTRGYIASRVYHNSLEQDAPEQATLQSADLTIAPGNSGGPVFDDAGNVVGMSDAVPVGVVPVIGKGPDGTPAAIGITVTPYPIGLLVPRSGLCASISEHNTTASK